MAGSVMEGLEFSVETKRGKSQDGKADSSSDEGLSKGLEVELGISGLGIGWGMTDSKVESNKTSWEAVEVSRGGKRWGKVIFEWGEEE